MFKWRFLVEEGGKVGHTFSQPDLIIAATAQHHGGFHVSPPDDAYELRIDSNGFQARMSADAAGSAVCLFAFSQLSFEYPTHIFAKHFHWLRDFALDHAEAGAIFQAID